MVSQEIICEGGGHELIICLEPNTDDINDIDVFKYGFNDCMMLG